MPRRRHRCRRRIPPGRWLPAVTLTIRLCTTSSASCPPAAKSSVGAGVRTMCDFMVPGSSISTTPPSGTSSSAYESVDMISDPGLTLTIYVAEPASPTARALDLLASWNSTIAEADTTISI